MDSPAYMQIIALLTRVQNYPGLDGLSFIERRIEQICQHTDFTMPEAFTCFVDGLKHDRNDELDPAIVQYQACLAACSSIDIALRFQTHVLLASIYADREQYQQAYDLYQEVLSHSHLLDTNFVSLAYTNISDLYLSLEKYSQAVELAQLGAKASQEVCNPVNEAICLLNVGMGLGQLGDPLSALEHFRQSLSIAKAIPDQRIEAIAHGYIAQILMQQTETNTQKIQFHFEAADQLYKQVKDQHNSQENLTFFAEFLTREHQFHDAQHICDRLAKLVDAENNFGFYARYCEAQIVIYEQQKQWETLTRFQKGYLAQTQHRLQRAQNEEAEHLQQEIAQLTEQQEHQLLKQVQEQVGAITDVGQSIATVQSLEQSLPFIYEKVSSIFPTDEFGIALFEEESQLLDYRYFYDCDGHVSPLTINCKTDRNIGSYVVTTGKTVHINNVTEESISAYVPLSERRENDLVIFDNSKVARSVILTPIRLGQRTLGVLSLQHHLPDQYQRHHVYLFEQLAGFIAISLENLVQRQHLQHANAQLDKLSKTDPLTGLYNRYQLDKIAPTLIKRAKSKPQNFAIAIIDIDYYKGFNDCFGHQQGDLALKAVAKVLTDVFSNKGEYLFRYGGDEFLLIAMNQSCGQLKVRLTQLEERIASLEMKNPSSLCSDLLTLSIGATNFTQLPSVRTSFESLFNIADEELYKVKEQGRNHFRLVEQEL
ncbi:GGDEF domain-containing protein [Vibrio alfacsensis]|uniref:sensor domain-containing diguanylate cyclase n=1 Tax=Vibrio alfacsensis TaxID=1074311 RepID=UPI001BF0B3EF|nr:GGDEF domain-containing protein [Vibrio alfacsensis]BBM66417.1 GGDEF domain-containing protein [Vibrio alfacsensis]